jgi:hypothetical protein
MFLWPEKKDQSRSKPDACRENSARLFMESSKEMTRIDVFGVILPRPRFWVGSEDEYHW